MLKEAIWNDKVIFFAFSWYDLNVSEYFESSNRVAANIRNILHRIVFSPSCSLRQSKRVGVYVRCDCKIEESEEGYFVANIFSMFKCTGRNKIFSQK